MLVQYSDDEDDSEASLLTQDPASNVKVTVHIPPPQLPTNTDNNDDKEEAEENYLNLGLLQGVKRPAIKQPRTDREEGDSDSSSDEETAKPNNKKQKKIETCNAIMPTASKTGRYNYNITLRMTNLRSYNTFISLTIFHTL
jgi:hypothetical protein